MLDLIKISEGRKLFVADANDSLADNFQKVVQFSTLNPATANQLFCNLIIFTSAQIKFLWDYSRGFIFIVMV